MAPSNKYKTDARTADMAISHDDAAKLARKLAAWGWTRAELQGWGNALSAADNTEASHAVYGAL